MARVNGLGIDPGFGAVKVARTYRGAFESAGTPSIVGTGSLETGLLDTLAGRQRLDKPQEVIWGDCRYLVGAGADRYDDTSNNLSFERWSAPETQALVYATIHKLLGASRHQIASVAVGLPVEIMVDRERALAVRKSLREWLDGEHSYTVDGDEVRFAIDGKSVQVWAQPAGAYMAWASTCGLSAEALQNGRFAIVDIGFNTLDVFAVHGTNLLPVRTGGANLGVRVACENLRRLLSDRISLHQCNRLLLERYPKLYTASEPDGRDISAFVNQAKDTNSGQILSYLGELWRGGAGEFTRVIFTGGGAEMFRRDLLRAYPAPRGVVIDNPVAANANGLALLAGG